MVQFWQVGCVVSRSLLAIVAMIEVRLSAYRERGEDFFDNEAIKDCVRSAGKTTCGVLRSP